MRKSQKHSTPKIYKSLLKCLQVEENSILTERKGKEGNGKNEKYFR